MLRCPFCEQDLVDVVLEAGRCPACGGMISWEAPEGEHDPVEFDSPAPEPVQPIIDPGLAKAVTASGSGKGSVDATLDSHHGPKPGTWPQRFLARTIDTRDLTDSQVQNVKSLWKAAVGSHSGIMATYKTEGESADAGDTLVIQQRAMHHQSDPRARNADYELLEVIGEGGVGIVYAARQGCINRTVAVKMLREEVVADDDQQDKFLSEAVVTGELEHPNIVPIYDLGKDGSGKLFYSMKRVKGTPWSDVVHQQSLTDNINILMKTADAIAFAHSQDVVHRDLKPENIMLGDFGEVLVMDWGIAMSSTITLKGSAISESAGMGGTPAYMAPEMATGPIEVIGPRSDVYLLGAILFEVITGNPPHTGSDVMGCLLAAARNEIQSTEKSGELLEIAFKAMSTKLVDRYESVIDFQKAIREYQSHSESIALSTRAEEELEEASRSGDYQDHARVLFGFEEALALWSGNDRASKGVVEARLAYAAAALDKGDFDLGLSLLDDSNPSHRALHEKLKTAQKDRDNRAQRLKGLKRLAAMLIMLVIAVGVLAFIWISRERNIAIAAKADALKAKDRAEDSEKEAVQARDDAKKSERDALDAKGRAEASEQDAIAAKDKADKAKTEADLARAREEDTSYYSQVSLAAEKAHGNAFRDTYRLLMKYDDPQQPEKSRYRHWEWAHLMHLCKMAELTIETGGRVEAVAMAPDGKYIVAGTSEGLARIWQQGTDASAPQQLEPIAHGRVVRAVAVSPDGQYVATGGDDELSEVRIWKIDAPREAEIVLKGHTGSVVSAVFSASGKWLLTSSVDGTARLWDWKNGSQVRGFFGHHQTVYSAAFAPLASTVSTRALGDEERVVTASEDRTVMVWSIAEGRRLQRFRGHQGPVYSAAFSPDGQWVVSAGHDKRLLLWRPQDVQDFDYTTIRTDIPNAETPFRILGSHAAAVRSVQFDPAGNAVVSCGHDNTVKVWSRADANDASPQVVTLRGHAGWVRGCVISPDGQTVLSGGYDGQLKAWDLAAYQENVVLNGHEDEILAAALSPDGKLALTGSRDRTAKLWNTADGKMLATLAEGHEYFTAAARFFDEGRKVVTTAGDNTVRAWDVARGGQLFELQNTGRQSAVAVSAPGLPPAAGEDNAARILTGSDGDSEAEDHLVKIFSAANGKLLAELAGHQDAVTALAVSADSKFIVSADKVGRVLVWEFDLQESRWKVARELSGHTVGRAITAIVFLPDSRGLLTASEDKSVGHWNAETGEEDKTRILRHSAAVKSLSVSADGKLAVTTDASGRARLWNVQSAQFRPIESSLSLHSCAITDDGKSAVLSTVENQLLQVVWGETPQFAANSPLAAKPVQVQAGLGSIWSLAISPASGEVMTVGGNHAWMWDLETGQRRRTFSPHGPVDAVAFSQDGLYAATASSDGSAKIWCIEQDAPDFGKALRKITGGHGGRPLRSVAFDPHDSHRIVTAGDDDFARLWSWDEKGAMELRKFPHESPVTRARFTHDGGFLLTATRDGHAYIFDLSAGGEPEQLSGHHLAVLDIVSSREGQYIATASDDATASIWKMPEMKQHAVLKGHTASITSLSFSPDGKRIVTGSRDNTAKLWDVASGREILTLNRHTEPITAVDFDSAGRNILTAGLDDTALLWLSVEMESPELPQENEESPLAIVPPARLAE